MYESPSWKASPTIIYVALVVSWIIILVGIWIVFFRDRPESPLEDTLDTQVRYIIGEQVILEWTLTMSDDISQFSHLLTTADTMVFGIKSYDVALQGYSGKVQIKWEVVGFKKQIPIVQVAEIVGVKWDEMNNGSGSTSYTYLADVGLWIDLSAFPGYSVKQLGNDIELYDTTNTKLLVITPFVCTAWDPTKDCAGLKTSLQDEQRFTNSAGMTFYADTEQKRRIAFDGTTQGFILIAESESNVQTYASIFEIVDTTMFDARLDEMKSLCKDINSRLATVATHEIVILPDGSVKVGIDGATAGWVAATCVVATSLSSPANFSLVSYTWPTTPETDAQDTWLPTSEKTEPSTDQWTSVQTTPKVSVPAAYATRKTYPSVRWRTMYVERNVISYDGVLWTWQAWCPYQLNLSYRTNATWAGADSIIYECTPQWATALKSAWYTTIGVATGVEFLRKDISDSLKGIDVFIQ